MIAKIIFWFLAFSTIASANIIVSEIMHAPTQTSSETDGEWIELFNNGNDSIDLAGYKINSYNFDDVTLEPNAYLVIARELIDGSDEDAESFESYWGNNNGMWDDGFDAVDGYFSLNNNIGAIAVTAPDYTYAVNYTAEDNALGKSLIWNSTAFISGRVDGTPGRGENDPNELPVTITIVDNSMQLLTLTINGRNDTYEILPFTESMMIFGTFSGEVTNISLLLNSTFYHLTIGDSFFSGAIQFHALTGSYEAYIFFEHNTNTKTYNFTLNVPAVLATKLEGNLAFPQLEAGKTSQPQQVIVKNQGNVPLGVAITATDLYSEEFIISKGVLEIFRGENWLSLKSNIDIGNIGLGENTTLLTRMNIPGNALAGNYLGHLRVIAHAS